VQACKAIAFYRRYHKRYLMTDIVKILIVEHNSDDIELLQHELTTGDIRFVAEIVQTGNRYVAAIENFQPDIILSDYSLPAFSGEEAFSIRQQMAPQVPFIFVSGSIGEDASVEFIRNGVTDYVLKEKLFTVSIKVKRALKEAKDKQAKLKAEQDLALSESQLAKAQQLAGLGSWELNFTDNALTLSAEGCRIFGFPPHQKKLPAETWQTLVHPDDRPDLLLQIKRSVALLLNSTYQHRIILKDGTIRHILSESKLELDAEGKPCGMYGTMQDVTASKKAAAEIKKAIEEKEAVLDRIDDGFFAVDINATVTYWNSRAEILLDTKREDIIGKNLHEMFSPDTNNIFYQQYQKALSENTTVHFEAFSTRANKWFSVSAYAAENGLSIYFKDVTERKDSEDKIKKSELHYRSLIEQATDAICIADASLNFIDMNPAACRQLGYTKEEALALSITDMLFAEDLEKNPLRMDEVRAGKTVINERRFKRKDGSAIIMDTSTKMLEDGTVILFGHDLTERKKAAQEMAWLINNTEESFILLNRNLQITSFNAQAGRLYYKYFLKELEKGRSILDYARPDRIDTLQLTYAKALEGQEVTDEIKIPLPGAVTKTFRLKYKPARDEQGDTIGVFVSVIDITQSKEAEEQLILHEKRYRALVENGADAVAVISAEGKITYVSPTIKTVLGYTEEEVMALDMFSFLHPDDTAGVAAVWKRVLESPPGVPVNGHTSRMRHKNGSWRWIEATVTNMLHDPVLNGIVDNFRDITESIEAAALQEFERRDRDAMINATEDLVWSISGDYRLIAANEAFINSLKNSAGITLKPGDEILLDGKFPEEFLSHWRGLYLQAMKGESFITEIYTPAWGNHPETWAEIRFNPIYDNNEITGIACYSRDTTATKIFQNKLVAINNKLETAQQIAHLGYWELDIKQQTLFWSNEVYNIWGVTPDTFEVNFKNYYHSLHPDDREQFDKARQNAIEGKKKMDTEHRIVLPDGTIKYVHEKGELVYNNKGEAIRFEGTVQDITERKKNEATLVQRDKQLTLAAEMSKLGYWEHDIINDVFTFNDQFYAIFKTTAEQAGGYTMCAARYAELFVHPEDRGMVAASIEEAMQSKDGTFSFKAEHRIIYATGEIGYVSVNFNTVKDRHGRSIKNFGVNQDITERKKSEEKIKESNLRYSYVTKATSDAIWDWDLLTNKVYWGEGFQHLFGYSFSEKEQDVNSWTSHIHPEDIERVKKKIYEFIDGTAANWEDEYRYLKSDKTYTYVKDKGFVVRDAENKAIRLVGAMQDISKQKREEQHLKLLESVITNANDSVIITEAEPFDEPGPRIVYVNEAFTKMTGYTSEEVLGKSPRLLQGPKTDPQELKRISQALRLWQPCEATVINYKKNGEEFWLNFSVTPVANEKGWFTHWISVEKDVTAAKLAEIKLIELNEDLRRHAKELSISNAELEQFAYVASHDLQEPLRMVTSFMTLLEKKYGHVIDAKGKKYIAFAIDGAKRMRQIILDLLEFSRVGRMEDKLETLNLNEMMEEIKILYRKELNDKKASIRALPLPVITAYKSPLRQVLQNLVSNALKYSKADIPCQVEIAVSESATHWQFSVTDNGIGIDREYFNRIFVIFQRLHNKDQYSGTGMGLAITKKIVETQGGKIWVESEEGKGSTFYFTILKH
jgi:PAS domain S-box-containing protein